MLKTLLLFSISIFPCNSKVYDYLGKHPELFGDVIDAMSQCKLHEGMTQEQVMVMRGEPIANKTTEFNVDGKNFIKWQYNRGHAVFIEYGGYYLLYSWTGQ